MSAFVDPNLIVHHLTGTPPDLAARASTYLAEATELYLTDLIVAETISVLESFYETPRAQVAETVRLLLGFEPIVTVDPALLLRAVEVYEADRIDYADAYLVACAETTGVNRVASFDRSTDRVTTIDRIEPPEV